MEDTRLPQVSLAPLRGTVHRDYSLHGGRRRAYISPRRDLVYLGAGCGAGDDHPNRRPAGGELRVGLPLETFSLRLVHIPKVCTYFKQVEQLLLWSMLLYWILFFLVEISMLPRLDLVNVGAGCGSTNKSPEPEAHRRRTPRRLFPWRTSSHIRKAHLKPDGHLSHWSTCFLGRVLDERKNMCACLHDGVQDPDVALRIHCRSGVKSYTSKPWSSVLVAGPPYFLL